jgi:hypothetical protein
MPDGIGIGLVAPQPPRKLDYRYNISELRFRPI